MYDRELLISVEKITFISFLIHILIHVIAASAAAVVVVVVVLSVKISLHNRRIISSGSSKQNAHDSRSQNAGKKYQRSDIFKYGDKSIWLLSAKIRKSWRIDQAVTRFPRSKCHFTS